MHSISLYFQDNYIRTYIKLSIKEHICTLGSILIGPVSKQGFSMIVIIVEHKRSHCAFDVNKFLITSAKY